MNLCFSERRSEIWANVRNGRGTIWERIGGLRKQSRTGIFFLPMGLLRLQPSRIWQKGNCMRQNNRWLCTCQTFRTSVGSSLSLANGCMFRPHTLSVQSAQKQSILKTERLLHWRWKIKISFWKCQMNVKIKFMSLLSSAP